MRLYEHPKLRPLEIWHGQTSQGSLFKVAEDYLDLALFEFLSKLYRGTATVLYESDQSALVHAKNFKTLYLAGGKAQLIFKKLANTDLPFDIKLIEDLTCLYAYDVTIDWGQTTIKCYTPKGKQVWQRDLNQFPIRCSTSPQNISNTDSKIKIRNQFSKLLGQSSPKKIGLALPLKMDHQLNAEPSTYEGLEGNLKNLFAGITNADIEFMNDAVLTARQIYEQNHLVPGKSLIVTLGYGVGAALWDE
tara:strand:- start:58389 stop:59129 length:741 start_codon:yes stop_codon:yes gene_type:complete